MHLFNLLSALSILSTAVTAQHGKHKIPEVEVLVQSATSVYSSWKGWRGTPTGRPYPKPPRPTYPSKPKDQCAYWLENVKHQGISAFNPNPSSYQTFRNVKDFGAKGDGVTDDTAAINLAISSGGRCAPGTCGSSTVTPAVVYFPAGTYVVSSSIIDYYYTQMIGNPNCPPVLLPTAEFTGFGVIDGNQYGANGLGWGATNVFWRQIRNFVIDMRGVPFNAAMTGIHWPTAQATSLQNIRFLMSSQNGTQHQGLFIEEGSGGFMNDLVFSGGLAGMVIGNQQFTMRNISIYDSVTAINQLWDWGWTYKGINIKNCSVGLNIASGGPTAQAVGSVAFFDSSISDTPVGIVTARDPNNPQPVSGGSLILENVQLNNVPVAVQGPGNTTALAGTTGSSTVSAWGQGRSYLPNGPNNFQGPIPPNNRPGSLLSAGGKFYERSKPQYENVPLQRFLSARDAGASGDGRTDDTEALQKAIFRAARSNQILFIDAGTYVVTSTLYIPSGSRITGETYPVIMSSGKFFADIKKPQPVVQVGKPGERGTIEWTDTIVSTRGPQAGAILIQYNLANSPNNPAGMWDVHVRVGGFAGSDLLLANCPTQRNDTVDTIEEINPNCISGYLSMHITKGANGLYMENCWIWVADHDIEDPALTQITIYAGRGLHVESEVGNIWLVGTGVEHHVKYEYQFVNTRNVFMGQIQTETAYYQPNPNANLPFPYDASLFDPVFPSASNISNNANGWGLRIKDSRDLLTYGAGLYSFFYNQSTVCSAAQTVGCQTDIFSVEGRVSNVPVFNLNTVGTSCMITRDGRCLAQARDNVNTFINTVALFRT
ncbi:hypothetical protein W97_08177 [Coniosporium apollinis CBS 100218]|uniref:Rhamnogalacturonase A/B/Epimerase-like pectate lyase domain-containing protein n=1 Tax=Coniosporium apollinis (strain CBS 100218) TaxID=1168221 RepID=R7Z4H6_CONA1|nr:uncharacterized protein W97_08177 [Coniosporium apollinis CBS 100218]EON68919.1 hypothetical protein W97_08177 [Coniosporium apollinis CBS 100218]